MQSNNVETHNLMWWHQFLLYTQLSIRKHYKMIKTPSFLKIHPAIGPSLQQNSGLSVLIRTLVI